MKYLIILFFSLLFGSFSYTLSSLNKISFLIAIVYTSTYFIICFIRRVRVSLILISLAYLTSRFLFGILYFTSNTFQMSFGDGRNYHIPKAINLYEYDNYIDFLIDPQNFNGQFTQFLLNFYHRVLTYLNLDLNLNNVEYGSIELVAFIVNTFFILFSGIIIVKLYRNISGLISIEADQKILLLLLFNPFIYAFSVEPIKEPLIIFLLSIYLLASSLKKVSKSILLVFISVVITFIERFYMALIYIIIFPFLNIKLGFNKIILGFIFILGFVFLNYFYSINDLNNLYNTWQSAVEDKDWSIVSNYSLPFNILRLFFSPFPFRYFFEADFFINTIGFTSIIYSFMIGRCFLRLLLTPKRINFLEKFILLNSIIFVLVLPFNPTIKLTMFSVMIPLYFTEYNSIKNYNYGILEQSTNT